ncbi:TRAP transporter small permease [Marivita sp. GX14005]|nr:TRAP transporter small permease subunit [Marivita sp. GX14005]MCL3880781.1 TRAP transporter small permease [Marivita sp. GX14005]
MALIGGAVLLALIALTSVSVLGRGLDTLAYSGRLPQSLADGLIALGAGPITGDFELVEAGIAFAIFAFLPICQLQGGHATVDIFTSRLGAQAQAWLAALWEGLLSAAICLITWRLGAGMLDKLGNGETTFLLQFPVWWAYAASLAAAAVASVVAIWCVLARLAQAGAGQGNAPGGEAE